MQNGDMNFEELVRPVELPENCTIKSVKQLSRVEFEEFYNELHDFANIVTSFRVRKQATLVTRDRRTTIRKLNREESKDKPTPIEPLEECSICYDSKIDCVLKDCCVKNHSTSIYLYLACILQRMLRSLEN
jgi:hypothetical protein